jgi:hypothetical protein
MVIYVKSLRDYKRKMIQKNKAIRLVKAKKIIEKFEKKSRANAKARRA